MSALPKPRATPEQQPQLERSARPCAGCKFATGATPAAAADPNSAN